MSDITPSADDVKSASPGQALIDQIDKAAPPEAQTPDPKAEGEAAKTDSGEPAAAPPDGEQGEGKSQNKVTAKERISQLTSEKHLALRRAEAAEAKLRSLSQAPPPPPPTAPDEEHEEFRLRKVMREERVGEVQREVQDAARDASQAVFNTFEAKAQDAADRFPGLVEKFLALPVISREIAEFVSDSDVGAELAHHFVEKPIEADRISRLSPYEQGKALARIEATIAKPARKQSTAPPPPPSTPTAPASLGKSVDDMSVDDMSNWYRKRGRG